MPASSSPPSPASVQGITPTPKPRVQRTPPKKGWGKKLVSILAGLIAVLIGATAVLWWWAGTDGSLATALRWVEPWQPLRAQNSSGSLRAGGHVDSLSWQKDGISIDARDVTLAWQPWALWQGTLQINRLAAASVQIKDERAPSPGPAAPPNALGLPLAVALEDFSVGQLRLEGASVFKASALSGNYRYNGLAHQLELTSLHIAQGNYSGKASLSASEPMTLKAQIAGTLSMALASKKEPLALSFQASAQGLLTDLQAKAELDMTQPDAATKDANDKKDRQSSARPQASATARIMPWAAQPLPQADVTFRALDLAALWPDAPQTLLTGSAHVQPLTSKGEPSQAAWGLQLTLANAQPGPWDRQRLPLETLKADGEWRHGAALVQQLQARMAGGEVHAQGRWGDSAASATPDDAAAAAWAVQATLKHVNPALLHSQLGSDPLDGRADVNGQGALIRFDASVQAAAGKASSGSAKAVVKTAAEALHLRQASATGHWNSQQAGGTLVLSALRVRTDDAELKGQLEAQPAESAQQGGKGKLTLTAPGLDASVNGELRRNSGKGELNVRTSDAGQLLRWVQKLPGVPANLAASASGQAQLQASWQGGWADPALQARLEAPQLDWQLALAKPASRAASVADATPPAAASPNSSTNLLKIRALQASLSGRLSQAQLNLQSQLELNQRRYSIDVAAEGGAKSALKGGAQNMASLAQSSWQGLLKQLKLSVQDPALGAGTWQLATQSSVPLQWTPTPAGGRFEAGAGRAALTAPASKTPGAASTALIDWQPVRWRAGELVTAGKLSNLPLAWVELLMGPQMAGAGLGGNLVLQGQWDAVLGDTLKLKAELARQSGDITVQAEGAQGSNVRVAAGVKQARLSLDSAGDSVALALRWDSERAGTADGQLKTRLTRAADSSGAGGWVWSQDAPLTGQLTAQLPRIGVWSLLAPPGWRLRGSLATQLTISGTRGAPQLAGELNANDLALRSVVDGIEFAKGRLRARLDGTRMLIQEFTLEGAGEKGSGGTLSAQGEAGWIGGQPQVQLDVNLQRLRASLRTDRQLTVSGKVQASLRDQMAALTGQLVVDQARILLPDEGTPKLGDDVLVRSARSTALGQEAPAQASADGKPAAAESAKLPLKLAVQLDLGRDFRIQGKGIDTRVRGNLTLVGDSLLEPRLTGTVRTVGGQYRAYGQRLDIEQGLLRFTGAIDNPALDILAIRPNLTQRVGVQITGTALLPNVRLYAQPELPDAEKLSWLVVGRPSATGGAEAALLQQAALALLGSKSGGMSGGLAASLGLDELSFSGSSSNGDGTTSGASVTLGKRFSRNFYAAYERSVSGALGTLFVFYDLSQRFTLRAQAGDQSAVDLIYTVPYD